VLGIELRIVLGMTRAILVAAPDWKNRIFGRIRVACTKALIDADPRLRVAFRVPTVPSCLARIVLETEPPNRDAEEEFQRLAVPLALATT